VAWAVAPEHLAEEAADTKHLLDICSPPIEQRALAHLIRVGEYERHIRRARGTYRLRRDVLMAALRRHLPDLQVEGIAAGLHVLVRFPQDEDDEAVAMRAECGVFAWRRYNSRSIFGVRSGDRIWAGS
jgi:GntR family transcriptional regulator/MocR family aminotransferase